jgi:hypothetical protein
MATAVPVDVSVFRGAALAPGTATLTFLRNGSGLDAMHLTRDLVERKGQVTRTTAPEGTFYVTATGGGQAERTYLLVAVDRVQPVSFRLTVDSRVIASGGVENA